MKEFSSYISETWNIREPIAREIAESFEKGDSPFFCADYLPSIAGEVDIAELWPIYDFLQEAEALGPQKKRLINALKKSNKFTEQMQRRITFCFNPYELDDILLPERANPRSKAQIALKKGLGPLADQVQQQNEGETPLEESAAAFVGKDPSLKSADDVIAGVKDILAERFAYDETARTMVREFAYDDGFFEVQLKNKKDAEFGRFAGKQLSIKELQKGELLMLLAAEDRKAVRLKLGVQLFRISELVKHHFITNSDCAGFDIICQAIDDCWLRLLQPIVERDIKERLRKEAEQWAVADIAKALMAKMGESKPEGIYLVFCALSPKNFVLVAFNAQGRLLGASLDKRPVGDKPVVCERLRQFANRYRPTLYIIPSDESAPHLEEILKKSVDFASQAAQIVIASPSDTAAELSQSEWMKTNFADLDETMRTAFALGLSHVQPVSLMPKIGMHYFSVHPLQSYISEKRCAEMVQRVVAEIVLHDGISLSEANSAALHLLPMVSDEVAKELLSAGAKRTYTSKNDLLKVPAMTEVIFRNIAGYLVIPYSENPLDRTTVHPDHFPWVSAMCNELAISADAVINNPEVLRSFTEPDMVRKLFVEKKLMGQLEVGQRFTTVAFSKYRRKLKLDELLEGAIVGGHVTNITPFGVFVNLNAVCEGLIHISQLADTYIETPEQVVTLGQMINVRIIKIDPKKRRISLSMKGLSTQPIKVSPSKRQLSTLASHFQNR